MIASQHCEICGYHEMKLLSFRKSWRFRNMIKWVCSRGFKKKEVELAMKCSQKFTNSQQMLTGKVFMAAEDDGE